VIVAGVLDRFERSAKRTLALAQDEAVRLDHGFVGPEHLLLGLIRDTGSPASRALRALGAELQVVRAAVETLEGRGDPAKEPSSLDLNDDARRVLELAPMEAEQHGSRTVEPEHLLLGLVRAPGRAASILDGLGISLGAVVKTLDTSRGS
jgi:ATP-dependent Clp protease ATP-binding subunit ClpC